jgi:hypothetical protein
LRCVSRIGVRACLTRTMGQLLVCAARRAGGEDGIALAHEVRDMVCDPDVAPEHWPLTDLIALLHASGPLRDRQVALLLGALRRLVNKIDAALDAADF